MTERERTWDARHRFAAVWRASGLGPDQSGAGLARAACGCVQDLYSGGRTWEPCMAHETDGHLSVVSEQDGVHVARCLVLRCDWRATQVTPEAAVEAAQAHWRQTAADGA